MSGGTKIQWADDTWNPVAGCSVVSPGCTHCYAMKQAGSGRLVNTPKYAGLTKPSKAGPVWTGEVRLWDKVLTQPIGWQKPRRIFVNSMSDLFHEKVPDGYIDKVLAVAALAPQHKFLILTKRADRMRKYMHAWPDGMARFHHVAFEARKFRPDLPNGIDGWTWELQGRWPLPNVWLIASVEDQPRAEERIPDLLATPAAVRGLSMEPLLEAVDITAIDNTSHGFDITNALSGERINHHPQASNTAKRTGKLDWVIVGGESGPGARPFDLGWARSIRNQCQAAGVPVFIKQLGANCVDAVNGIAGAATKVPEEYGALHQRLKDRKGGDWDEWPEDLRVREWPE